MNEPLPLARIHDAVLGFLQGRDDAVLFGAQAVNAYVDEPRMTQDVHIMSTRGAEFAEEVRAHLANQFHIAVRLRDIRDGLGYRIYQIQKPTNRHLVDVRPVAAFPPTRRIDGILVPVPEELIANKVSAWVRRKEKVKGFSDRMDLARLLLSFPELKSSTGPVRDRLNSAVAPPDVLAAWEEIVAREVLAESDDEEFEL